MREKLKTLIEREKYLIDNPDMTTSEYDEFEKIGLKIELLKRDIFRRAVVDTVVDLEMSIADYNKFIPDVAHALTNIPVCRKDETK